VPPDPIQDPFALAETKFKELFKGFADLVKDTPGAYKEMFKDLRKTIKGQQRANEEALARDVQGPPQLSDIVANPKEYAKRYPRDPMYAYDLRDADRAWLHANDEL